VSAAVSVFARQRAALPVAVVSGFLDADPLASLSYLLTYPDQREEGVSTLQAARAALGDADYDAARARGNC
jgi:hypothetical protein